ncbi:MAG: DUF4398 domain-containing protein [Treponema sp.]|nr:DUF4398 domain-containing protein [Treponema sp.]
MKIIKTTLPILIILLITACATPPTEEMNMAKDAVVRAENDADAVAYAPNLLVRARDALTKMQNEANNKRYDSAKNFANEAVNYAERAISEGRAGAARAREEAANLVNGLQTPLAETANALDNAQRNDIILDYDGLSSDLDTANQTYDNAKQSLQADDYPRAITQGQNVRSMLNDINSSISQGAQAASRKQ